MTIKLKQLTKIGILIFGISMFFTACEKESTEEIITQEKFDAPSIELAKQFVNSSNNTSNPNVSFRSSSSDLTSVAHWEGSKIKKYKETEEQNVDILYTPIYVNSSRTDIKGFIASTEQNGIVDSRKFYILYKSNDLSNGLNAYILIYGLDGNLQQAYNFENGQSIPLPESSNGNVLNRSSGECDGDISSMNDEEFENWWANCNIALEEVVVTATTLSNDGGNNSGSTSAFNDWNSWVNVYIPAVTDPNSNYNNGNTNGNNTLWHTPNVTVANAPSISAVLDVAYNSAIANWLREMEQINQQILNQIADYLNANREENPFSDFTFGDIQPEQFPVSDFAIEFISQLITIGTNNSSIENILSNALFELISFTPSNYPGMNDGLPFEWWKNDTIVSNNIDFNIDGVNEDLTTAEKWLVAAFPAQALLINANREPAQTETVNRFGFNGRNDKSDAFRHAFFNAMNSNDAGDTVARLFSNAHESEVPANLILEVQMDFHNNDVGHTIGDDASIFVSDQDLSDSIYQALLNGELVYLSPLGPIVPPNFGINSSTQLIPTDQ